MSDSIQTDLVTPSYEEWVYLAAFWSLCDAEPPRNRERMPLGYEKELLTLSRAANKRRMCLRTFDNHRGDGLPSHRQVRVRRAKAGALA